MRVKVIGAAAAVLLGGLAFAPAASADSGDGLEACNRGEICFTMDETSHRYRKHFWYSGSHSGYTWWDATADVQTGISVRDSADLIANRDTICNVKVIDDRGLVPDDTHDVANNPGTAVWVNIRGPVDDENDRHERHNCGG
jgi:transposase